VGRRVRVELGIRNMTRCMQKYPPGGTINDSTITTAYVVTCPFLYGRFVRVTYPSYGDECTPEQEALCGVKVYSSYDP